MKNAVEKWPRVTAGLRLDDNLRPVCVTVVTELDHHVELSAEEAKALASNILQAAKALEESVV